MMSYSRDETPPRFCCSADSKAHAMIAGCRPEEVRCGKNLLAPGPPLERFQSWPLGGIVRQSGDDGPLCAGVGT
jgi:hypothetical protein